MKIQVIILILCSLFLSNTYCQFSDSTIAYTKLDEVIIDQHFRTKYRNALYKVRKVYPMALKAKAIIDEYELTRSELDKKKEIRKYSKKMSKFLKEEFSYSIRDLYQSEGRLLMQLIHRETGKTVEEIIEEYAGGWDAFVYRNLAKLFDQDLSVKYDKSGENYYTEIVLSDIYLEHIEFNPKMEKMTKDAFKKSMKEYRKSRRENRKQTRQNKRAKRKASRNLD